MSPVTSFTETSRLTVKVNGSALQPEPLGQVMEVIVEQDLNLPDTFSIRVLDFKDNRSLGQQVRFGNLDADTFPIGATVDISMGYEETAATIMSGTITTLELDVLPDGTPYMTARGYSKAVKLHRERKSKTFANVKDSDLASQLASANGLQATTDDTTTTHEHVYQDNLTDWEFLRSRAERNGYELFVSGSKLFFRKPPTSGTPVELKYGETLVRLRMRLSAAAQVSNVEVQSFNWTNKQQIVGTASSIGNAPSLGESRTPGALGGLLSTGKYIISEQPVDDQTEANALAQSLLDEIAGDFMQIEGTCAGDDSLRPGSKIKISGVGTKFSGTFYLSSVTHRISGRDGYYTNFTVSGRRPLTLGALLSPSNGAGGRAPATAVAHPGVVVGLVTNVKDPKGLGRIKVKLPSLGNQETTWAPLATPMSGGTYGVFFLPEVNDTVLVAFEEGDVNHPYIVGSVWNGQDKPPKAPDAVVGSDGKVNQRIIKTRSGHIITIDDSTDAPGIFIVDKTGNNKIELDSKNNALTIKVNGNMTMEAQGDVTLKGANVTVQATTGNLSAKAQGNFAAEATGNVSAKATGSLTMESQASATLKANAQVSVQSSGITEVKGSLVKIN